MSEVPFSKNSHVRVIKEVARGLSLAKKLNVYVELGIRKGPTFNEVAPLAKVAHAIDTASKCLNFIKHNKNLKWHCKTSTEFLDNYSGPPFDLVFIDASHVHKDSLNDFKKSFELTREGGMLILHDTYPPDKKYTSIHFCGDTYKTAEYIRDNYLDRCETITLPFYFGLTVVRKTTKQLGW